MEALAEGNWGHVTLWVSNYHGQQLAWTCFCGTCDVDLWQPLWLQSRNWISAPHQHQHHWHAQPKVTLLHGMKDCLKLSQAERERMLLQGLPACCPNGAGRVVLTSETLLCTARCKGYQSDFISAPRAKYAYSLLRPRMPCMSLAASFLGDLWHCRLDLTTRGRRWMVGKELCLCCGLKSLPLLETDWIYDISSRYRLCTTFWAFWMILHPYFLHLGSLVLCWSMKTFIQDSPATLGSDKT